MEEASPRGRDKPVCGGKCFNEGVNDEEDSQEWFVKQVSSHLSSSNTPNVN